MGIPYTGIPLFGMAKNDPKWLVKGMIHHWVYHIIWFYNALGASKNAMYAHIQILRCVTYVQLPSNLSRYGHGSKSKTRLTNVGPLFDPTTPFVLSVPTVQPYSKNKQSNSFSHQLRGWLLSKKSSPKRTVHESLLANRSLGPFPNGRKIGELGG